jgi:hypothetical protein
VSPGGYASSAKRKKITAAVANTAVAVLLTGPAGGLGEAARQAIDFALAAPHRRTLDDTLKRLRRDLEEFAVAESLSESFMNQAFSTAELAILRGGASLAECLDLRLDPHRIANRVLGRASDLLGDLDDGAADICRQIVRVVYGEILEDPQTLPQLEREFQRHVVSQLAELTRLPEQTARAVRALASVAVITDPRQMWDGDIYPESALVRAEFAVVPFHSRTDTLDELDDWCAEGPDAAFRLYTGAGGMGKTRLMIEVSGRLRARGWQAGFLTRGGPPAWDALFHTDEPMIITVDYAELQRAELRTLISCALSRRRGCRTRLVALARGRGAWWQDLARTGHGIGDFLSGPATSVKILTPVASTPQQRLDSFHRAAKCFAARLGRPVPASEQIDMTPSYYDRVLFVHLAALAAVLGQPVGDDDALLDFVLRREQGFWDAGLEAAGFADLRGRPVLEAAVVTTMAGRIDRRDEAVSLISRAPALAGQPATATAALAELLHTLYPGDGWLDGVQPDLLGEHLLYRAGQEDPAILRVFDAG